MEKEITRDEFDYIEGDWEHYFIIVIPRINKHDDKYYKEITEDGKLIVDLYNIKNLYKQDDICVVEH